MRAIFFLCAITALTACTTPEQRAAYHASEVDDLVVEYGPACDKMGYPRGTDPWRNCILQFSVKDDMARYGYNAYYGGRGRWYW